MKKGIIFLAAFIFLTLLSCSLNKKQDQVDKEPFITPDSIYQSRGDKLVAMTFDTLRSSLLQAIESRGLEEAISFCSEKAFGITAIYADSAKIRRCALRYRNPSNKPDSIELVALTEMLGALQNGKIPASKIVRTSADEIHFFKPILLQPMCLNCHGTPGKEINAAALSKIRSLYPTDEAVNFKVGDLRGAWHVIFTEKRILE